jgi:hypothetical protein
LAIVLSGHLQYTDYPFGIFFAGLAHLAERPGEPLPPVGVRRLLIFHISPLKPFGQMNRKFASIISMERHL